MCDKFIEILKNELVPAEGCTEPIAVAYAVSMAVENLGCKPDSIELELSANIIKNALGVGIPGTGMVGLDISVALGASIKNSIKKLEILSDFSQEELMAAKEILKEKIIKISQKQTEEKLYIGVKVHKGDDYVTVIICREHINVILIEKNNKIIYEKKLEKKDSDNNDTGNNLTIKDIYNFSVTVDLEEIEFILEGAKMNSKVSKEG
ncbi:MAG: serine dehydratase subunit alpha family protein, partial [Clostridium sp.]